MPKRFDQTTNATAVAATDHVPFITAGAVTSYVTGNELASSTPFSSRYAPLAAADRVWVPAASLIAAGGVPTLTVAGSGNFTAAWLFDASAVETIAGSVVLPTTWNTFAVDLYWMNEGAGAGNVEWIVFYGLDNAGDNVDSSGGGTYVARISAADIQDDLVVSTMQSAGVDAAISYGDQLFSFIVRRDASAGGDTLGNDAALIGVLLRRVS